MKSVYKIGGMPERLSKELKTAKTLIDNTIRKVAEN